MTSSKTPDRTPPTPKRILTLVSLIVPVTVLALSPFVTHQRYSEAASAQLPPASTKNATFKSPAIVTDPQTAKEELIRVSQTVIDESTLHKIALALAGVGEFPASQAALQRTKDPQRRRQTVEQIAELVKSLAIAQRNHHLVDALDGYAGYVPESAATLRTAYAVSKAYAGKLDQARPVLQGLGDKTTRGKLYLAVAQAAKQGGHPDHARALLEDAGQTIDLEDRIAKTRGLIALIEDSLKLGLALEVDVLLRQAVLVWSVQKESFLQVHFYHKLTQLTPVVKLAVQAGHPMIAKQIVADLSRDKSKFITIVGRNEFSLIEVAAAVEDYGLIDAAFEDTEREMKQAALQGKNGPALEPLIQSAVQFTDVVQARAILTRAHSLSAQIKDEWHRSRSLVAIQEAAVKLALQKHDPGFLDIAAESVWESELGYLDPIILAAAKLGDRKRTAAFYTRVQRGNPTRKAIVARKLAAATNDPSYLRDAWHVEPGAPDRNWTEIEELIELTKTVAMSVKDAGLLELARRGSAVINYTVFRAAVLSDLMDVGLKLEGASFIHRVADDLITLADGMKYPSNQIPVHAAAVNGLGRSGQAQAAKALLARTDQVVVSLSDIRQRTYLWGVLGYHAAQGGLMEESIRLFGRAKDALSQVEEPDRTQLGDWLKREIGRKGQGRSSATIRASIADVPTSSLPDPRVGLIEDVDRLIAEAVGERRPESLQAARALTEGLPITTCAAQLTRVVRAAVDLARTTKDRRFLAEAKETVGLIPKFIESNPAMNPVADAIRKFAKSAQGTDAARGLKDPFGRQAAIELFVETAARLDDWEQASAVMQWAESQDDFAGALAMAVHGWAERSLVAGELK